jgi:hypothetical protein
MMVHKKLHTFVALTVSLALVIGIFPPSAVRSSVLEAGSRTPTSIPPLSASTARQTTPKAADALEHPLSISRVQSSYSAGATAVVTYTVTNNLHPTLIPDVPDPTNITETVGILASFVITEDVNTLRNVALTTSLQNATFVDASGSPERAGDTVTWQLPELAPQAKGVVTLTLQPPATAADFVDLDDGAVVVGDLWDQAVDARARPAVVVPDTTNQAYTAGTVDADILDVDMLWKSATFTQDPIESMCAAWTTIHTKAPCAAHGARYGVWLETVWTNPACLLPCSALLESLPVTGTAHWIPRQRKRS